MDVSVPTAIVCLLIVAISINIAIRIRQGRKTRAELREARRAYEEMKTTFEALTLIAQPKPTPPPDPKGRRHLRVVPAFVGAAGAWHVAQLRKRPTVAAVALAALTVGAVVPLLKPTPQVPDAAPPAYSTPPSPDPSPVMTTTTPAPDGPSVEQATPQPPRGAQPTLRLAPSPAATPTDPPELTPNSSTAPEPSPASGSNPPQGCVLHLTTGSLVHIHVACQ